MAFRDVPLQEMLVAKRTLAFRVGANEVATTEVGHIGMCCKRFLGFEVFATSYDFTDPIPTQFSTSSSLPRLILVFVSRASCRFLEFHFSVPVRMYLQMCAKTLLGRKGLPLARSIRASWGVRGAHVVL